jgi:thymidine phosphorylase
VKFGSGAFIAEADRATRLAETLVCLAASEGLRATALLTAMDQPLGATVGNALEVREAIACLQGGGPPDLREVTMALCEEALLAAEPGTARDQARSRLAQALDGGEALALLVRLIEAQGGDPRVVDQPSRLPEAPVSEPWLSPAAGFVGAVDAYRVGLAAVELGAGRERLDDEVDPAVGFELLAKTGDAVVEGQPLAVIHARRAADIDRARSHLTEAYAIAPRPPADLPPLVLKKIDC